MIIEAAPPKGPIYRFGRVSAPLDLPPAEVLQKPARDRFDDPARKVRVLYSAETPVACLMEYLASLRPSISVLADLAAMPGTEPLPSSGIIEMMALRQRRMAAFHIQSEPAKRFLDLREPATRTHLRHTLAATLMKMKVDDLDASDALGRNRTLTQAIAAWGLQHGYNGIVYFSRYDPRLTNWALFEPLHIVPVEGESKELTPTDPDLTTALKHLGLRLKT